MLLEQLGSRVASSITVLAAGIGISSVIIAHLVKGIIAERTARSGPPATRTGSAASPPA